MEKVHRSNVYKYDTLSSEFRRIIILLATPFISVLMPLPLYFRRKASRFLVGWKWGRPHVSLDSVDKRTLTPARNIIVVPRSSIA
jgi:hypothetical protein